MLSGNTDGLTKTKFLYPYLNINDAKELTKGLYRSLKKFFPDISKREISVAVDAGLDAYDVWMADIRREGRRALSFARSEGYPVMILAGRPYHADAEVGHGIDRLAVNLGFVVVSEDSISNLTETPKIEVLNQWTYHARLYRAAQYAALHEDCQLVQLVSFGCGVDAITTDEIRRMLEERGKLYTQLKIDEITNLGAVKIRLRSLIGAMDERKNAEDMENTKRRDEVLA